MKRAVLAAILCTFAINAAQAHTVMPDVGGFLGGVLHPLLVPAHVLTLIALGLMTGTFGIRTGAYLLLAIVAGALAAFALIALAYSATQAETLVLVLGAIAGLILAANVTISAPALAVVTAAASVAVIFDSVPPVLSVHETASSLAGTALSAILLVTAAALVTRAIPQNVRAIAVRVAGSWIAASAIMVLALRLAA
jgi:urease accessory protein